ncbi:MAG: PD-(D/E)XK nuclease family protein [Bernardetiaceae bacterium]|nr:PD-(D/E)XK nuclease family protein [Bernardetiaceae bacterium]
MEKAFLQTVAERLLGQGRPEDLAALAQTHVVLPTRRACLYVKHYLAQAANQTLVAPNLFAIDDFIAELTDKVIPDSVTLLFGLYESYQQFDPSPSHNLDKFAPLGSAILNDFNLLDKNLVPANELFDYLEEAKAIERWAEELGQETDLLRERLGPNSSVTGYYQFWQYLKLTYWHFREKLLAQGMAYMGLAYRVVAEDLAGTLERHPLQKLVLAGFNQLSKSEAAIFNQLRQRGLAELYWDADAFYIGERAPGKPAPQHEAGYYFRKYQAEAQLLPLTLTLNPQIERYIGTQPQQITFVGCSNQVAQAKLAGHLLEQHLRGVIDRGELDEFKKSPNQVAILLPDEGLLLPVLHSLPIVEHGGVSLAVKDHINVTMGLSMDKTPLFSLVDQLFELQNNFGYNEARQPMVYHQDLVKLLRHPYIQYSGAYQDYFDFVQDHLKQVQDQNLVYVPLADLGAKGRELAQLAHSRGQTPPPDFYGVLFRAWGDSTEAALDNLYELTAMLHGLFDGGNNILESEYLLSLFSLLKRIDRVLGNYKKTLGVHTFRFFLNETIRTEVAPFTGEPLSPVQVMGMLESRAIDFRYVIVLSCNEGVLPRGKLNNSVVPYDLRMRYHIPTHTENDATVAYTFYRLLHRAKQLTFVYVTAGNTGEMSRFLLQIEAEMAQLPHLSLHKQQLVLDLPQQAPPELQVEKTPDVLAKIREYLANGVTPSHINLYVRDPLEFFQRHILKLDEARTLEEDMELQTFGTVVHDFLEQTLKQYENQALTPEQLKAIADDTALHDQLLEAIIKKHRPGLVTDRGKNYLLKKVAAWLLETFFNQEAQQTGYHLVAQETELKTQLDVPLPSGERVPVTVKGKADRIDVQQGKLRIVDYKTGGYTPADLKARHLTELLENEHKGKVIQLFLYKYLVMCEIAIGSLDTKLPPHLPRANLLADVSLVQPGFYFFRKLKEGFIGYKLEEEAQTDLTIFQQQAEQLLTDFVSRLLDPTVPFARQPPTPSEGEGEDPESEATSE